MRILLIGILCALAASRLVGNDAKNVLPSKSVFSSKQIDLLITNEKIRRQQCGPTCLFYILQTKDVDVPLSNILGSAKLTERGMSLLDLERLCQSHVSGAKAIQADRTEIGTLPLPAIICVGEAHCVVLVTIDEKSAEATIFEPASRKLVNLKESHLRSLWTGEAIVFGQKAMSDELFVAINVAFATFAIAIGAVVINRRGGKLAPKDK